MLLERAEMQIRKGEEEAFAVIMKDHAAPLLAATDGVLSVQFGRGVENSDKFILLVAWADLNAHTAFTKNPVFPDFCAMLMPYSVGGAMEHFKMSPALTGVVA